MSAHTIDLTPDWATLRKKANAHAANCTCPLCRMVMVARQDVREQVAAIASRGDVTIIEQDAIAKARSEWGLS